MRLLAPALTLSIVAGLGVSSPALAIYDWWDGDVLVLPAKLDSENTHPNAGTVVFIAKEPGAYPLSGWPDVFTACSGSLIDKSLYLTAKHCTGMFEMFTPHYDMYVTMDPEPMVSLGVLRPEVRARLLEVTETFKAPDMGGQEIDLAVLQLKEPAKSTYPGIEPIRIAPEGLLDDLVAEGDVGTMTFAGYGCTGAGEDWEGHPFPWNPTSTWWDDQWFGSRHLGEMPFRYLSGCPDGDEPCPPPWDPTADPYWGEQFVMAYGVGNPVGYGDSGSPMYWEDPRNGKRFQVAVVKHHWWSQDENGVWVQEITSTRLDHPLPQQFLDCVMRHDPDRDACLDCLEIDDAQERDACVVGLFE